MKTVHQPDVVMSAGWRNDVTSNPNVGIVQMTAMITAAIVAPLLESRFFESLNAAVAGSTLLYEAMRQREVGKRRPEESR